MKTLFYSSTLIIFCVLFISCQEEETNIFVQETSFVDSNNTAEPLPPEILEALMQAGLSSAEERLALCEKKKAITNAAREEDDGGNRSATLKEHSWSNYSVEVDATTDFKARNVTYIYDYFLRIHSNTVFSRNASTTPSWSFDPRPIVPGPGSYYVKVAVTVYGEPSYDGQTYEHYQIFDYFTVNSNSLTMFPYAIM